MGKKVSKEPDDLEFKISDPVKVNNSFARGGWFSCYPDASAS